MKNIFRLFSIITFFEIIGFGFFACDLDGSNDDTGTTTAHSLDGVWESGGTRITFSGNTGVISAFGSSTLVLDAANKGYIELGGQKWRNLTSSGNLTWSGQDLLVTFNTSSPNVAIGTSWNNCTFTMSADGNTLQTYTPNSTNPSSTWTRGNYSLDGVWESGGTRITFSGNTGVISAFGSSTLVLDAANKGYIKLGDQKWRNLTSSGNLTWSGQDLLITYNTSSPNVAIGTSWNNCTFTMNADGRTVHTYTPASTTPSSTWTRYR